MDKGNHVVLSTRQPAFHIAALNNVHLSDECTCLQSTPLSRHICPSPCPAPFPGIDSDCGASEGSGAIVCVSAAGSTVSVACCAPVRSPVARGGHNPAERLWFHGGGGDDGGGGYGPFEL